MKLRSIITRYLVVSLLILLIIFAFIYLAFSYTNHIRNDARRINLAGRERMLNVKTAYLLNRALAEKGDVREKTLLHLKTDVIPEFEEILYGLRDGSERLGLAPVMRKHVLVQMDSIILEWEKKIKPLLIKAIGEIETGGHKAAVEYNLQSESYVSQIDALVNHLVRDYEKDHKKHTWLLIIMGSFALIVFVLIFTYVRWGFILPLLSIRDTVARIKGGDFDARTEVTQRDEIGELAKGVNDMAATLKTLFEDNMRHLSKMKVLASFPEKSPFPIAECSRDLEITYLNPAARKLLDKFTLRAEELLPEDLPVIISDMISNDRTLEYRKITIGERIYAEYIHLLPEGVRIYANDITDMVAIEKKIKLAYEQSIIYAKELRQKLSELRKSETELKRLSSVIENSINLVIITDPEGIIEYVNPIFEKITGYSREEVRGQNPRILSSGETPRAEYEEMWETIRSGKTWKGVFKNRNKDGRPYWVNAIISPVKDDTGNIKNFIAIEEDITEKRESLEKAEYLASYDPLTGLINRERFMELLGSWISRAKNKRHTGVLILIDIDEFKAVNDIYGHLSGDQVLKQVAACLKTLVERMDAEWRKKAEAECFVSRLGSDEFFILMPQRGERDGLEAADVIRKAIEETHIPGVPVRITASLGVAIYPIHGNNTKDLLSRVDAAALRAKELGRNRCHLYRPEDRDLERLHRRMEVMEEIKRAIDEGRILAWYQPILNIMEDKVDHYEALIRMRGVKGNIIQPGNFMDIAESFGLIGQLDRIVIEQAMKHQSQMRQRGHSYVLDMNLSGKDIAERETLKFIRSKLKETGAEPERLVFEITETAAIGNLGNAIEFINHLKEIGCKFSLDDFGVGFTSFTYLKEMKVDYIKIDGSFIRRLHENPKDQLFVKAMVDIARGMGIKTVAEFVETEETLKILKRFGVDYAQGYFIGRPAPEIKDNF